VRCIGRGLMALMRERRRWLRGCIDRGLGAVATNLRESSLGEDTGNIVSTIQTRAEVEDRHSHEKTGLSAGTVTDNDQLATDLGHLRDGLMGCGGSERNARGRR
jgi:hypothetical protein